MRGASWAPAEQKKVNPMTFDTSECEESRRLRQMMLDANGRCALLRADLADAEHIAMSLVTEQRQHKETCPVCRAANSKPQGRAKAS
jgi:hypothetical protein